MTSLTIGLDLGTTLCKASAFELDGRLVASAEKKINTYRPYRGWAEQDPLEWKAAVLAVLAKLTSILGDRTIDFRVIGVSSHGPSLIPTDEDYHPLWRCPIWQDHRSAHLLELLIELAGESWIGLGTPEASFGVELLWTKENRPEILQQAAHLFDTKGYLLSFLTGRDVDEPSSSPGGENGNSALFQALQIDTNILPGSVPSISVVGNLTADIRSKTNLPPSTVVVAGLNDGAAATLGAGIVDLGQGIVSLSTNGVMRTTIAEPLSGSTLRARSMFCYPYVKGLYVTGGMTKCGGDSVSWLIENFFKDCAQSPDIYERISREANESPPGSNGSIFMPYLVGIGTQNPSRDAQGAFLNLNRQHKRSDFTRALLEGAAFALKDIGETFDDMGLPWENLIFTGGGSKNPTWRQIVADILAKPLRGARSDSVLGVALLAATGVGLFPDVDQAVGAMVDVSFQVEPSPKNVETYARLYERFKHAQQLLSAFSERKLESEC